ncbi:MAG: AAA family ATPase [Patescibacteria group bacterium]
MIITINGRPGSGKSTTTQLLAKALHFRTIDVGQLRRKAAKQHGMTLHEFNQWSEKHPNAGDKAFDRALVATVKRTKNVVVSSRTAFHFFPQAFNVFLDVSPGVGARRIQADQHDRSVETGKLTSVRAIQQAAAKRMRNDDRRYRKLYGINIFQQKNYSFILNTTRIPIPQVVRRVQGAFRTWQKRKS